ncbi:MULTISPECIES: PDR/VanB family oxidoreductase [Mycolicibacterium]|jgi:ferredoxin-NADP reductase|uniref:PDR/VanB family oxidoreductase n=1 Tax=Mycolicibacterium TaxID=1866885 RepID=UPI001CA31341|nr:MULTISPECIES: PDR/VanB family oxidoreductase [Mycolicibacterium]MDW5612270.1 PDR/VanB family oxidoreductase [Mycolicibacterium sp. D5.8-2]QZT55171.1 PDR/VanB family oxidoreductase [Mycolicibacterium austroafricanum]
MTTLKLTVAAIDDTIAGIRTLTLTHVDEAPLPSFTPGSHLVVECGARNGPANAYSLTGDGIAPAAYVISVLRAGTSGEAPSGSRWIHDELAVGDTVLARPPRSAFAPILRARRHLLVAAGIGITPMVSHLRSARLWGRDARLLYIHRPGRGAYVDTVRSLTDHASIHTLREEFVAELSTTLADQPLGTHLYVCGPASFIDFVAATATELGWPASRIHFEHFGAGALDPGEPFTVRVPSTADEFTVEAGVSLLEALESRGFAIPNLCRRGVCGECRVPVSGGAITHRDLYLSDDEKRAGNSMMACVSRAASQSLELKL